MPTPSEYFKRFSVMIITGGSSGIGSSLIKAGLKLSPNLMVCNLSRSKPDFFLGETGIHLKTDLAEPSKLAGSVATLREILQSAPAGEVLLINNSGFGDYGAMPSLESSKQLMMIDLNVRALVDLTTRLLPDLLARGGCVINVASTAGFQPTPLMATYGATKSFVLNWTLALNEDLRGTGLRALAICPGPTRSNFFKAAGFEVAPMEQGKGLNRWLDMTADEVAEKTFEAVAAGKMLAVTGWKNRLITLIAGKTPRVLVTRIGGAILRKMRLEQHQKGHE